jgi:hypothetical protein
MAERTNLSPCLFQASSIALAELSLLEELLSGPPVVGFSGLSLQLRLPSDRGSDRSLPLVLELDKLPSHCQPLEDASIEKNPIQEIFDLFSASCTRSTRYKFVSYVFHYETRLVLLAVPDRLRIGPHSSSEKEYSSD